MTELERLSIDETKLYEDQPSVRAAIVLRYEGLWKLVDQHNKLAADGDRPPDPRWAEIGVRVLKELSALYRLSTPPRAADEGEDVCTGPPAVDRIMASLQELEGKIA